MLTAGIAATARGGPMGGPQPAWSPATASASTRRWSRPGAELRRCLPLVRFRAQAMQEAVPEGKGAMAAILRLDDERWRGLPPRRRRGVVRAGELQRARADRDRRQQGGGRGVRSSVQGDGRQARDAAAGVRAVPAR